MMINRRNLLQSSAAAALASLPPANAQAAGDAAALNSLFDAMFKESLENNPQGATLLGLDKGPNAALKARLNDVSDAGIARDKAQTIDQLRRLKEFDASALTGMDRVNYDTVRYMRETTARLQAFDFGGSAGFGGSPYAVSQLTGAYQSIPNFLDTKHSIETAQDADAYLSRLEAFATQLDDDTKRMAHDTALGVIPPDFILDLALEQLKKTRQPDDQTVLVTSLARRARAKSLPHSYAASAARIYSNKIVPALERQIAAVTALRPKARHDARLSGKDSAAFYAASLQAYTTTRMTPKEIHRLGQEQGKEISARLDKELKGQGLTKGTVGERLTALNHDPKFLFPNTDAGKLEAIAYCNARLDAIRPLLPKAFRRDPAYAFEVRRVPVEIEAGAPLAYSQAPPIDGSRPGLVYFNLKDSADWPKFALATTVFHEGLPGHQMQTGLARANASLPLIRQSIGSSGYAEGWGLYAEQLSDELGIYDDDPFGRIGYLQMQLFRAVRLMVDTGIFDLGWSREKAIDTFVTMEGHAPGSAAREVERYCVSPGQACSYKLGHTVWVRARERAKQALGSRYDIRDFHEAGIGCGLVPLEILDTVIDRYIQAKAA
jgi:uncharacterized protein (DUF885 family)